MLLLKPGMARGLSEHRLRIRHRVARAFDADGDAVEGVAGPDQALVVLRSGVGAECRRSTDCSWLPTAGPGLAHIRSIT